MHLEIDWKKIVYSLIIPIKYSTLQQQICTSVLYSLEPCKDITIHHVRYCSINSLKKKHTKTLRISKHIVKGGGFLFPEVADLLISAMS